MIKTRICFFIVVVIVLFSKLLFAEPIDVLKLGFIGSLTGVASNYGQEALRGTQLAIFEYNSRNKAKVELIVEDDSSIAKNTLSSFRKLQSINNISGLISGTWWVNSIVKPAENSNIPIMSIETSFNNETLLGKGYFLMLGELRDWISVFRPLIDEHEWKRAAVVHFSSGFGQTLAAEMRNVFSGDGRSLVGDIEYSEIDASEAGLIALKIKSSKPDVLYIDGQPSSLATILKKLNEVGLGNIPILSNSIVQDMCEKKLYDCQKIEQIYFNRRKALSDKFQEKYESNFGKVSYLNADIAYFATLVLIEALKKEDAVKYLKEYTHHFEDVEISFDDRNVSENNKQEVWALKRGEISLYKQAIQAQRKE